MSDSTAPVKTCDTSLYRYYDKHGLLLYVGITSRGIRRNIEHTTKEWWPLVVRQEVEHLPTRDEALAAERSAIVALQPPFNKQHNPDHEGRREAYWRWTARAEQSGPFKELYASMQGRLPLYCMSDDDGHVQLTTTPEHWNVVKHINIDDPRHVFIPVSWDGQRIGTVIPANFHFHGPMLWLAFTKRTPHLDRKAEMMFARLVMNAKKGGTPVLAIKRIWIEK